MYHIKTPVLSRFRQLYRNYAAGHITPEEFRELRDSIDTIPDDYLWRAMLENSAAGKSVTMPKEMKEDVRKNLRRSILRMRFRTFPRYAAAAVSVLIVTAAMVIGLWKQNVCSQEFIASIPAGSRTNLTLPDRSRVQMNSASELIFEWDTEGERTVRLSGEAYFDVAKDSEHVFRVLVSDIEVEVHGTSFNVNAYDDQNVAVSLVSGNVSLGGSGLKGNRYMIHPGEKAVYCSSTGSLTIARADMSVETGWTRGNLVFEQQKLSDVIAMIERRYGVEIDMQCDSLADDTLTGTFCNEDISNVLASLGNMYGFKYIIRKNHITIY